MNAHIKSHNALVHDLVHSVDLITYLRCGNRAHPIGTMNVKLKSFTNNNTGQCYNKSILYNIYAHTCINKEYNRYKKLS